MKAQVKADWLAALRSGKYQQVREALYGTIYGDVKDAEGERDILGNGYCCLGVLAQVVDPARKTWDPETGGYFGGSPSVGPDANVVAQIALVGSELPVERLASMNDSDNLTFPEIADWIEANIPVTADVAALETGAQR